MRTIHETGFCNPKRLHRWLISLVLCSLVSCAANSSEQALPSTTSASTQTVTELTTTTVVRTTTTTEVPLSRTEIIQAIRAETQRACDESVLSNSAPQIRYDSRWSRELSRSEMTDRVQACVDAAWARLNAAEAERKAAEEAAAAAAEAAARYVPTPADFRIEVVETERSCFGSAGCNVRFRINPTYIGATPPDVLKSFTVVYEIRGADDPQTGSFTLSNGQVSSSEDYVGVPPGSTLSAVVVRVLVD